VPLIWAAIVSVSSLILCWYSFRMWEVV